MLLAKARKALWKLSWFGFQHFKCTLLICGSGGLGHISSMTLQEWMLVTDGEEFHIFWDGHISPNSMVIKFDGAWTRHWKYVFQIPNNQSVKWNQSHTHTPTPTPTPTHTHTDFPALHGYLQCPAVCAQHTGRNANLPASHHFHSVRLPDVGMKKPVKECRFHQVDTWAGRRNLDAARAKLTKCLLYGSRQSPWKVALLCVCGLLGHLNVMSGLPTWGREVGQPS